MTGMSNLQRVEVAGFGAIFPKEKREFNGETTDMSAAAPIDGKKKFDINALSDEEKKKLDEELKKMNESLASTSKILRFKYDEKAKTTYVEVLDAESNKVLASLPPEFLIDLSVKMKELIGMFLDKRV